MYWLDSIILSASKIVAADVLTEWRLTGIVEPLASSARSLLVHVETSEDMHGHASYVGLTVLACQLVDVERQARISLTPLLELLPDEQQALRQWLIDRHWSAWARAVHSLRSRLGIPDLPVSLSQGARQTMIPLPTLQSAAAEERLPTIRAADRQLIYVDTIIEAQARGLLHYGRGRPPRQKRPG